MEQRFTKDELLDERDVYWVTETINSANRLYFDREYSLRELGPDDRIRVPCAFAMFPADIDHPPREYAEAAATSCAGHMPRGGQLRGVREPELLVDDLCAFFRDAR